jgi:O-methyltransferase involved in polyketide biosynthesis
MALPPALRWIEIDFPRIIAHKTAKLAGEHPVCRLEYVSADLSDLSLRRSLLQRLGSETRRALVLTEGLIAYLTAADAGELSRDLFAVPSFQFWIQDYYQGVTRRWAPRRMRQRLKRAPFKFDEADPLSYFQQDGWTVLENRLAANEAARLQRPFPFVFPWSVVMLLIPESFRQRWRNVSGYVMFQKPELSNPL